MPKSCHCFSMSTQTRPKRTRKAKNISENFVDATFSESESPKLLPLPKPPKKLMEKTNDSSANQSKLSANKKLATSEKNRALKALTDNTGRQGSDNNIERNGSDSPANKRRRESPG